MLHLASDGSPQPVDIDSLGEPTRVDGDVQFVLGVKTLVAAFGKVSTQKIVFSGSDFVLSHDENIFKRKSVHQFRQLLGGVCIGNEI